MKPEDEEKVGQEWGSQDGEKIGRKWGSQDLPRLEAR